MPSSSSPPDQAGLSGPSEAQVGDGLALIESLARAARQVALYGPDHPVSLSALSEAIHSLEGEAAWEGQAGPGMELSADGERLLWRNAPLPAAHPQVARLRETMHQRLIATIGFRAPICSEDVARLLVVLAEEPKALAAAGGAMRRLSAAERPSSSVRVEDVDFARGLRESEAAWLDSCQQMEPEAAEPLSKMVQYCLRTQEWAVPRPPEAPAGGLPVGAEVGYGEDRPPREVLAEAVARLIQQAGERADFVDEQQRHAWRLDILKHLNGLEAAWRAHVFRSTSGASPGHPDILTLIAREMSPEECVSLVLDYPGAISTERSGSLSLVLSRIMSDPARAEVIEPLLRGEAVRGGVDQQVYRSVVGVLMIELREMAQNLSVSTASEAVAAAPREEPRSDDLSDLLETTDAQSVRRSRLQILLEMVASDLEVTQHVAVLNLLSDTAVQCAADGDTASLREGLRALRRLSESGAEGPRAMAAGILPRTGTATVVEALVEAAEQSAGAEQVEAMELLGVLGGAGIDALSRLAGQLGDAGAEQAARVIIERDAPGYRHLRRLLSQGSREMVGVIVRAAFSRGDRNLIQQLDVLTTHLDAGVRLEVVKAAAECEREEPVGLLTRFLWDPEVEVRVAVINTLAERRAVAAVTALCAVVRRGTASGDSGRAREEAIVALGKIGAPGAVPTLSEVLNSTGLLDLFRGSNLRVAAAYALAMIGTPEAGQALEKGARDRQRTVREASRHALLKLRVGKGATERESAHVG